VWLCIIEESTTYARFLEGNPDEVKKLFHELLINMTRFLRDPEALEVLKTKILPEKIRKKGDL